jgi:hypothetical protein
MYNSCLAGGLVITKARGADHRKCGPKSDAYVNQAQNTEKHTYAQKVNIKTYFILFVNNIVASKLI